MGKDGRDGSSRQLGSSHSLHSTALLLSVMAISSPSLTWKLFSQFRPCPSHRGDVNRACPRFSVLDDPIGKRLSFVKVRPIGRTKFQSEGHSKGSGLLLRTVSGLLSRRAVDTPLGNGTERQDSVNGSRPNFLVGTGLLSAVGVVVLGNEAEAAQASTVTFPNSILGGMCLRFVSLLGDLDPGTAQLAITFVGPVITLFNLLLIFRIVMSWYPGIPVKKFPFFLAYTPTEPILGPTRKLIPPVGGVDVSPVIWVALMSFTNEILLGKQGLLVLLSQQQP